MKKLQLLFFLLFGVLTLSLTSCDDDNDDDAEPSRKEMLTAETWTGDAVYQGGQNMTSILLLTMGLDVKDIKLTFTSNGNYTLSMDGNQDTGTWEFTNNEQAILFNKGDANKEFTATINKLDNQELYLQGDIQTTSGSFNGEFRFRR